MEPGEALSTAAQIAVTLAGFAGVVVVFRRALVILLPFAIATTKSSRRFDPQQLKNAHATLFPFYLFVALGTGGTLLQFCNVGILNAFWPFFTGIVIQLLAAMAKFARIILVPPE